MSGAVVPVTAELLRGMPLPRHRDGEDKNQRGRVLVIGGSVEVPGGALLAGLAGLRAGAGKLQIATCRSVAPHLAVAVPEARVIGLEETPAGGISASEADRLATHCSRCDAVLLGPGMLDGEAVRQLTARLLDAATAACFVLDAAALQTLRQGEAPLRRHAGRLILTPHAGEMASLLGVKPEAVLADLLAAARQAAAGLQAVVAMEAGCTFIIRRRGAPACDPAMSAWPPPGPGIPWPASSPDWPPAAPHRAGGDALGRLPAWRGRVAVGRSRGPVGFLARELLAEIPPIMAGFAAP